MSSTLPRSRSLSSGANSVSSPSLVAISRDRVRPVSLCESSWGRVMVPPPHHHQARPLQRSPSQANNLSTTVPCSLVNKSLGGRHHPTRSSLRHSRMVVLSKSHKGYSGQHWSSSGRSGGLGRVGALVIAAQTLMGIVMGALAVWCLLWAPRSVPFREVPHYSAIPMFVSGLLATMLLTCCSDRRRRTPANFLKGLIVMTSGIAIVTCLCVCIFTSLHLVYLAPMKCRSQRDVITRFPTESSTPGSLLKNIDAVYTTEITNPNAEMITFSSNGNIKSIEPTKSSEINHAETNLDSPGDVTGIDIDVGQGKPIPIPTVTLEHNFNDKNLVEPGYDSSGYGPETVTDFESINNNKVKRDHSHFDEEDFLQTEGSGDGNNSDIELLPSQLELQPSTTDVLDGGYELAIHVEVIFCVCETWNGHWKRTFRYPDLTCLEVNRVLPVLSVATCIVTAGSAVLSGVVLYLLWAAKDTFYEQVRPSEIRPFIFSSNLKRSNSVQYKVNGVPAWNGNRPTIRNGHSRHDIT